MEVTIYDRIALSLRYRPLARAVYLATDLWERHVNEQADEGVRESGVVGVKWYCEGRRVMHDPRLREGKMAFCTWPEGIGSDPIGRKNLGKRPRPFP